MDESINRVIVAAKEWAAARRALADFAVKNGEWDDAIATRLGKAECDLRDAIECFPMESE